MSEDIRKPNVAEVHAYWRRPDDGSNEHWRYLRPGLQRLADRSEALVNLFSKYVPKTASVLEVGSNSGRNLKYLFDAGYTRLSAIEINEDAIRGMRKRFPEAFQATSVHVGPVEDVIEAIPERSIDAVFTMAVLIHLHNDSDWVIPKIADRAAQTLVVVEHEQEMNSWRHFKRDYRAIFEGCGFEQVEEIRPFPGLPDSYVGRVFRRP